MEKVKPTYDELKNKALVELTPVMTSVSYYVEDACVETLERFSDSNGNLYEHRQVVPMTDEQLKKLSISVPRRVLKSEFKEVIKFD